MTKIMTKASKKEHKAKKHSPWRDAWRRLCRNRMAVIALGVIIIIVFSAVFAEYLTPYDYAKMAPSEKFTFPCLEHPLGTDNHGRDLLTRILKGGQSSLVIALISTAISTLIGAALGATAAYFGKTYATIVMRLMDIIMGIPPLLFAVCISVALGTGVMNTIIAISVPPIATFTRITYAQVLKETNNEYIEAATICGARDMRKVFKHLLPNSLAPIIVQATLRLGQSIMIISSLSFIGLGVQPPTPEWGSIMASGRQYIRSFWPIVVFPGIAIAITVIAFNLLGDGLRDALDPRLK